MRDSKLWGKKKPQRLQVQMVEENLVPEGMRKHIVRDGPKKVMFKIELVKEIQFKTVCCLRGMEIKVTERGEVKELH